MTDQTTTTTAAAAIPTTEQVVQEAAKQPVADIKAMAAEIGAHIDAHDIGETASTWLANARSALANAVHYVEQHFEALEAKVKAEVASIEAEFKTDTSDAEAKVAEIGAAATAPASAI